jgi:hypothetical protein
VKRIPKWTPPIDGWQYPIERTERGLAFVEGPSFRIVKLPQRWRVTYTSPQGTKCTGWNDGLEALCRGLTRWLQVRP